jgi:hypothetical protein
MPGDPTEHFESRLLPHIEFIRRTRYRYPVLYGETMTAIQLYKEHPETWARQAVGTITEKQLDFLMENLEEEFEEDQEYFLVADTIDFLKEQGADRDLIALLERALSGTKDGIDIFYVVE